MQRKIFGSLIRVNIPALGIAGVIAKVDTGAWNGALHCTDIVEENGVLRFSPLGEKSLRVAVREFVKKTVRSASGHQTSRYIVPIEMVVEGELYKTQIGLSNRKLMRREMLLGRRFLLENAILVDVALSRNDDIEAESDL